MHTEEDTEKRVQGKPKITVQKEDSGTMEIQRGGGAGGSEVREEER